MKKSTLILCAAVLTALPLMAETIEFNKPSELNYAKAADDGSILITRRSWMLARKMIPADPKAKYKVSIELRGDKENLETLNKHFVRIGLANMDGSDRYIGPASVFHIDGSETTLAAPVKVGDTVLKVTDSFKWKNTTETLVVYDCDPTGKLRDLPNNNSLGYIKRVDRLKNEITLAAPAKVALEAGVCIRQHQNSWGFTGSLPCKNITTEWQAFSFTTVPGVCSNVREQPNRKIWKHAVSVTPIITTFAPLYVRNLKVEIIK